MRRAIIAVSTAACAIALAGCAASAPNHDPATPKYTVTADDRNNITAVVDTMPADGGLQLIFDDIAKQPHDDGGYHVIINCATGGTANADNRLGNGMFAIGSKGAAQTGLDAGTEKFEPLAGAVCPG